MTTALPTSAPAILLRETGGADALRLEDAPVPAPGPGEILVRQEAAGVNFIDIYHRTGLYPMRLPGSPGSEGAGIVAGVGEGVTGLKPGDRVVYLGRGLYRSFATVPASSAVKLPEGIGAEAAAALWLKGLTAWMLLSLRPLQPGMAALVWAPAGGVGSLLVPWAAAEGLEVVAVTSTEAKAELARKSGAAHVLVGYQDVAERAREALGRGADIAFDSVGEASQAASLAALARRGWYVSYGNASGPAGPVSPMQLAAIGSAVMTRPGLFDFVAERAELERGAAQLFAALAEGTLPLPEPRAFPLGEAAEAHRALESGKTTGAMVLLP